jgi:hypothetical protein
MHQKIELRIMTHSADMLTCMKLAYWLSLDMTSSLKPENPGHEVQKDSKVLNMIQRINQLYIYFHSGSSTGSTKSCTT